MNLPWVKKLSLLQGILLSLVASFSVAAQIKPDATLPPNSPNGNVLKPAANAANAALTLRYQIDGGTKAGNNLFHSFTQGISVWAQAENSQSQQLRHLIEQAQQQEQHGQRQQALKTLQQALTLAQQLNDRKTQAEALFWIGSNQNDISI